MTADTARQKDSAQAYPSTIQTAIEACRQCRDGIVGAGMKTNRSRRFATHAGAGDCTGQDLSGLHDWTGKISAKGSRNINGSALELDAESGPKL